MGAWEFPDEQVVQVAVRVLLGGSRKDIRWWQQAMVCMALREGGNSIPTRDMALGAGCEILFFQIANRVGSLLVTNSYCIDSDCEIVDYTEERFLPTVTALSDV